MTSQLVRYVMIAVCVVNFERIQAISQHEEPDGGAPPGPKTNSDHAMINNLGRYCPKTFKMAKGI